MTTVVALSTPLGVWMSADTGTNVYDRPVGGARKIRRLYDDAGQPVALIGISGSAGAIWALRTAFDKGDPAVALGENDPEEWACGLAERITRALLDAGPGRGHHAARRARPPVDHGPSHGDPAPGRGRRGRVR